MDRNPPVTVTVAVVSPGAAEAGSAAPKVSIPATAAIRTPRALIRMSLVIFTCFSLAFGALGELLS
jgi:hypothetical protein